MLKQIVITIALVSFFSVFTLAQEKTNTEKKECSTGCCSGQKSHGTMQMSYMDADSTHKNHNMKSDNKMHNMNHEMKSDSKAEQSIIHEGVIDLKAIDENKDGKVYQDQMCWNVISDKPGECPQCGMTLKEVSLQKAKENLIKHDFKVKEK
uniref:Heavy metal binding domain-containing protein n=1 Tax=Ignavibacterium album TaxID=591197 RepID=A0A7V2ZL89_9BACT